MNNNNDKKITSLLWILITLVGILILLTLYNIFVGISNKYSTNVVVKMPEYKKDYPIAIPMPYFGEEYTVKNMPYYGEKYIVKNLFF